MNYPYGLIPIPIAVILTYFISWGLARIGVIHRLNHRRIWNTMLLITFLVTGILGILLAVQVNFKIDIPWIRKVLQWHVNFGIGMVCISFIHFYWHIKYYAVILLSIRNPSIGSKPSLDANNPYNTSGLGRRKIVIAIVTLGFISILTQLIVLREFVNIFQGNELIIGLILSIWMILTAVGSRLGEYLGSKGNPRRQASHLFLIGGLLPACAVILLYLLNSIIFAPGILKGIVTIFLFCFILLLPFCIVSGMLFTLLASLLSGTSGTNRISEAYGWESAGSAIAGILFSLVLAFILNSFQLLAIIPAICTLLFLFVGIKENINWTQYILPVMVLLISVMLLISPVDKWLRGKLFANQEIIYSKDTPYGNISITRTAGQNNFYENGGFLFSSGNSILDEEAVHFTMLQHPKPEKILVVSGGIKGMTKQVLKYLCAQRIDYAEINPWLINAENKYGDSAGSPLLKVINQDARAWIKKVHNEYDVIILNTPDPSTAQLNRYYTNEFFHEAKNALRRGGVLSISLSSSVNYLSEEARTMNRIIYHTLLKSFKQVEIIPGERNYYLASDNPLRIDISRLVNETGIENEYVNPYYIDDALLSENNRQLMSEISKGESRSNTDLAPIAYFYQIQYWLSFFNDKRWILPLILLIIILVAIRNMSPVAMGVFVGGFTGASAEFLILIVFQILYGFVYQMLGAIVAFYMIGLTAGSILGNRYRSKIRIGYYIFIQGILLVLSIALPMIFLFISHAHKLPDIIGQIILMMFTATISFIAGLEFYMASHLERAKITSVAANLYGIDMAGAAIGILIITLICYPLLGLLMTCLLLASLNLLSIFIAFLARRIYN